MHAEGAKVDGDARSTPNEQAPLRKDRRTGEPFQGSRVTLAHQWRDAMTKQECLAHAAEAEAMMNLVSFGLDKDRLRQEALEWRERAGASPGLSSVNRIQAGTDDLGR
jgi:hypothetical protein